MARSARSVRWAGIALACIAVSVVGAAPARAADHDVAIEGSAFAPSPLTVSVGDSVTWTNHDAVLHTATAPGDWSTGDIVGGGTASIVFRAAGTYDYMCAVHPAMRGRLIVREAGVPPTDSSPAPRAGHPQWPLGTIALLAIVLVLAGVVALVRFRDDRVGR